MRSRRTNRKSSGSDPFAAALRLLTFRDRSKKELADRLLEKGHSQDAVAEVVSRCTELGYLDDERFAATRARTLVSSGRAVGIRALQELKRVGINSQDAEQALALAESEYQLAEILTDLCQRRFPQFEYDCADEKERRRVLGFFQRRGFPISLILDTLKNRSGDTL